MPRVFFPTGNNLGVRDLQKVTTLGGVQRAPAEADPHPAMNPVNLGRLGLMVARTEMSDGWTPVAPIRIYSEAPAPPVRPPITAPTIAPPVSTQSSPTPQVSAAPPPASAGSILVTSGGGTVSPNTNPPASSTPGTTISVSSAAPTDITGQIAAWLGGSTTLFGYSVPNAILAGAVVLGFAALSSGGGKRR
jgi:hypothetical protein